MHIASLSKLHEDQELNYKHMSLFHADKCIPSSSSCIVFWGRVPCSPPTAQGSNIADVLQSRKEVC